MILNPKNLASIYVRLRNGRYPHTPIVRVASADDYGSHSNTELYFLVDGLFVRFWASGEQSSSKWEIPCPGRHELPCIIWRR